MTNEPARESQAEPPAASEQRPDGPGVWWRDGERYVVLATLNGTLVVAPLADDGRIGPWHTPIIEVPQSLSGGWSRAVPASELADLKAKLAESERRLKIPHPAREFVNEFNDVLAAKDAALAAAEHKLAFLATKGLTVGLMQEAEKEPHLAYDIKRGSELCDLDTVTKMIDVEIERDKLRSSLTAAEQEIDRLNGLLAKREADRAEGWPELPTFSGKAKRKSDGAQVLFRSRKPVFSVVEPDGFIALHGVNSFEREFEVIQPEAGE